MLAIAVSILLATVSWQWIEAPFRKQQHLSREQVFAYSGLGTAVIAVVAVLVLVSDGIPSRIPDDARAALAGSRDVEANRSFCLETQLGSSRCIIGDTSEHPTVVLLGDSHATATMSAIDLVLRDNGRAGYVASHRACAPLLQVKSDSPFDLSCRQFLANSIDYLRQHKNEIDIVILIARWPYTVLGMRPPGEPGRQIRLAAEDGSSSFSNQQLVEDGLARFVSKVRSFDMEVIILGGVPEIGWNVPRMLANSLKYGRPLPATPDLVSTSARHDIPEGIIERVADQHGAVFIPIVPFLCTPQCLVIQENRPLYVDDDHLSAYGARHFLGPRLSAAISSLGLLTIDDVSIGEFEARPE